MPDGVGVALELSGLAGAAGAAGAATVWLAARKRWSDTRAGRSGLAGRSRSTVIRAGASERLRTPIQRPSSPRSRTQSGWPVKGSS